MTVGGNLIDYPGDVSTRTADLTTVKCHLNSVISTPGARYCCVDLKNFYLGTPLDRPEYIFVPLHEIPPDIQQLYKVDQIVDSTGKVYLRVEKGMYGLPQSGKLANDLLAARLAKHGYYQV